MREENDGRRVLFFTGHESSAAGEELPRDIAALHLRSDTEFDRATFSWSLDGEIWRQTDHTIHLLQKPARILENQPLLRASGPFILYDPTLLDR